MNIVACRNCGCKLAFNYVRYRDTAGNPYCYTCYERLAKPEHRVYI